jgi:predicted ABC-type ATPase
LTEFVNADVIAQGLSGFDPLRAALLAGQVMLARLDELTARRATFAFETTLASRSFAPRLRKMTDSGYRFDLVFFWLRNADLAIQRVADRVKLGGHDVPEVVVRRRYAAGLSNFFRLYQPLATTWRVFDNSRLGQMALIAEGRGTIIDVVEATETWVSILEEFGHGK